MGQVYQSLTELIGNTPLLELKQYAQEQGLGARILAKLESFNPAGSVKDRVALSMIQEAEQSGRLRPGAVLIEPTSGNTGIGLAAIAAARGYRLILTMARNHEPGTRALLKAYGAQLVLTEGAKGMKGAIAKAEELHKETPGSVILGQFVNPRESQGAFFHDRPGNLAGYGRKGGCAGIRYRYGRDHYRYGQILKGEKPASPHCGGGTGRFPRAFQGPGRAAQDPGDRRGVCPGDPGYRDL